MIDSPSSSLIVCQLTPSGRGAVAVIALRGNLAPVAAFYSAANGRSISDLPLNRVCFGHWGTHASEEVLSLRISPTELELHCHGGRAAVKRILQDLESVGAEVVSSPIWDRQQRTELEAECRAVLSSVTTRFGAHHALRQVSLFPAAVQTVIDSPRETAVLQIDEMLNLGETAQHLLTPWNVVISGRPNVGKSSLINAIVGYERTVVFDQPGTTRDVVTVETAVEGWPIRFSDTAGLRETESELEAAGIQRAKSQLQQADLILYVLDASEAISPEDQEFIERHPDALLVWNKSDLYQDAISSHHSDFEKGSLRGIQVSARTRSGLPELLKTILNLLIPQSLPVDRPFPISPAQIQTLVELRRQKQNSPQ